MVEALNLTGMVFKDSQGNIWKVTGPPKGINPRYPHYRGSYPVIRSTKTGKEFKEINGFVVDYVEEVFEGTSTRGEMLKGPDYSKPEKVDDSGIETGRDKRRIKFLENRIAKDTEELSMLKTKHGII